MGTEQYRFGLFELDAATGELRRDGVAVRLQAQPAQVLAVLVRNAGSVVSREVLREAVWGTETYVDFDRNLNYCVTQVRSAIGDSADSPRFIRTHPRKGYEFIAPVTAVGDGDAAVSPPAVQARQVNPRKLAFLATALALLAIGVVLAARNFGGGAAATKTIAVLRFDNGAGDQAATPFSDGLTDMVVAELTQGGGFAVIGNAASLRKPRKERDLKKIAAELEAHYIVLGQVFPMEGNRVRVLAHLIRMPDQKHLWVTRVEGDGNAAAQAGYARRIAEEVRAKTAGQ